MLALVESGPDATTDKIVRWRRIDLRDKLAERFGITVHERTVGEHLVKTAALLARAIGSLEERRFRAVSSSGLISARRSDAGAWGGWRDRVCLGGRFGSRCRSSGRGSAFEPCQAGEIISEVCHADLHLGAGEADGAHK